jgi:hypothetical protein
MLDMVAKHPIHRQEPVNFNGREIILLMLRYRHAQDPHIYEFSYKIFGEKPDAAHEKIDQKAQGVGWSKFMNIVDLKKDLDIRVKEDSIVVVDTEDESADKSLNMVWQTAHDAIMTVGDWSHLYGELRYWDSVQKRFVPRTELMANECRRIRFKAKKGTGPQVGHQFSYFVRLRDKQGKMTDYEIDPDIRNPSVDDSGI